MGRAVLVEGPACSEAQAAYFQALHAEVQRAYAIARRARRLGKDPSLEVEIPPAEDLAARVEAQVGPVGVADRIRDATKQLGNREVVSLQVARAVAADLQAAGKRREQVLDQAVRTGLSILTEGVLVAPLEGIAEVRIGHNGDGSDYVDLYFAGPIRAAGGTGQAMSVLIADVVRRELGIGTYRPTEAEVERYKEEIPAYKQAQNLQYTPSGDEIDLIVRNCPVCINGEGTEEDEVTGNRDLPRVETNRLRGGACLVLAEGLVLKAPKVLKHVDALKLESWDFLRRFKKEEAREGPSEGIPEIHPNPKYARDVTAGRPVLAHPSRPGGFRLRYGRSRTAGLAATSVHPALMALVDDFLAVGTQLKVERPGKGTLATPCDTIDPPTVLLRRGDVVKVKTIEEARRLRPDVKEIIDVGEMLVPFGEFLENNQVLPHASWCKEWWQALWKEAGGGAEPESGKEMVDAAAKAPLHPDVTLLWHDVTPLQVRDLSEAAKAARLDDDLVLPGSTKPTLEALLCPHRVVEGGLAIAEPYAMPLLACLGFVVADGRIRESERRRILHDPCQPDFTTRFPSVELVGRLAGFKVMPKAPCRIGARMGRPEKADQRLMQPPPHGLFPVGQEGGMQRLVKEAAGAGKVAASLGRRRCAACDREHWRTFCDCGGHTILVRAPDRDDTVPLDVAGELDRARGVLKLDRLAGTIKGVQGLINKEKVPEPLEKALLRARHNIFTFKDGTTRFDMTDVPLTHFRPKEIGTSVERLRELGYQTDITGATLERDDQLLELRVQDIVVSTAVADALVRTSQFVDDLLSRFYGLDPFYNVADRKGLAGHLAIGLAPHTSAGVLCRIIGFTRGLVHFGHPYFHAAKRRNCDGDEDAVMLLLDGLLNFSRAYVPDRRGGLMDLPLVLTTRLDPNEVDKEAQNVDTLAVYPLAFFEATTRHAHPKEVAKEMGLVDQRIGKPDQYEGFGFTHDTTDISEGPAASAYKTLGTMLEKMKAQLEVGRRIRAVDEAEVGARVIGTHLLPDLMGNLKAFSRQKVRCTKCSRKYRRMPLAARCLACGNPTLTLTVHEGAVRKYLEVAKQIAVEYKIDPYTHQRILLLEQAVESLFNNDKVRKAKLSDFF